MDHKAAIQESIKYIEENLCEAINLNDIARKAYISEFYFHRLFRNATGSSVMEYVRKRRLSASADALSETDEKITDIAHRFQYGSEESFSRAFKKAYRISPREYRNTCNKNYSQKKTYTGMKKLTGSSAGVTTLSMAA